MFVSGMSKGSAIVIATLADDRHTLDLETSGEETKVRLRWHEHWQARDSSKETKEEVTMPTQTSRVQQVRTEIVFFPRP